MVPGIAHTDPTSPVKVEMKAEVKAEQALLDASASASTEYIGRRPSTSSGRDTKRLSE